MNNQTTKITQLLSKAGEGSKTALDELLPLVYDELKRIANKQLSSERPNHTLQATALVNEAYLLLVNQHSVDFRNRLHFFSIASEVMRRILVNYAIAKNIEILRSEVEALLTTKTKIIEKYTKKGKDGQFVLENIDPQTKIGSYVFNDKKAFEKEWAEYIKLLDEEVKIDLYKIKHADVS